MTSEQRYIVQTSPWIAKQKVHQLDILFCKYQYEVIERIFLNVSASYGVCCKNVMYATAKDGHLYAYLCICILLIDEYLFKVFGLIDEDRNILLDRWMQVLADYYSIA